QLNWLRLILRLPPLVPDLLGERLFAALQIEILDFRDGHAPRETTRDDRARAGAGKQIEDIGKDEIVALLFLAEEPFNRRQHLQGEHAFYAAAIERENSFQCGSLAN